MKKVKTIVLTFFMAALVLQVAAQGGGQRQNIEQRVENEKKRVLDKVTDLSADQKVIFDQIYIEYGQALKSTLEASAGDRSAMREKMTVIRQEKEDALKDILSESQLALYQEVMLQQRQNRQNRRGNRGKGKGSDEKDSGE